jgi:DNA-binding beta-propeller fold protein YncE
VTTRFARTVRALLGGSLVLGGALTASVIGGAIPASASAVTASIQTGNGATGVSSHGGHVWVANSGDGTVTEINASNHKVMVPAISVGSGPHSGPDAISSDGTHVWVANGSDGTVTELNASNGAVVGSPITVGSDPDSISSDGTDVWVSNQTSFNLNEIDIASLKVTPITPPVGSGPHAVSSDGTHAWVAENNGSVDEYDSSSGLYVKNIPVGYPAIAVSSDGTDVWVALGGSAGTVSEIDASTDKVINSVNFNFNLTLISSDGTHVWVTSYDSNTIGEVNAPSGTFNSIIPGGPGNGDLDGVSSDGTHVWVANDSPVVGTGHVIEINPDPTTSVLVPANGAKLSGSTPLDASATNATSVQFYLAGGSYGYGKVIGTATPTNYGWVDIWNSTTAPNGSYVLLSEAFGAGGSTFSSAVSITVSN